MSQLTPQIISLKYRDMKVISETETYFKVKNRNPKATMTLLEVLSKSRNKSSSSPIYDITRFCASASLTIKMANHIRKGASVKENNVSEGIRNCSDDSPLKTMMFTQAEQL
jgi:hypothetical protein